MKNTLRLLMTTTLAATAALAQDKLDLTAEKTRASYAIGADIANSMKRQALDLDTKALAAGAGSLLLFWTVNAVKLVPNAATCSQSDAISWLMTNPSQLSALAKAAKCSVPATDADVER